MKTKKILNLYTSSFTYKFGAVCKNFMEEYFTKKRE